MRQTVVLEFERVLIHFIECRPRSRSLPQAVVLELDLDTCVSPVCQKQFGEDIHKYMFSETPAPETHTRTRVNQVLV